MELHHAVPTVVGGEGGFDPWGEVGGMLLPALCNVEFGSGVEDVIVEVEGVCECEKRA